MLLAGIALAAMAMAFTGILIFVADDRQLRDLTFWSLGSLAGATWQKVGMVAPVIVLALSAAPFLARGLNALSLGEATASHLGIPVQRLKYVAIVAVAAATGDVGGGQRRHRFRRHRRAASAAPAHRSGQPLSAAGFGAARGEPAAAGRCRQPHHRRARELPIGIVTAAAGGPFFLWILLRKRGVLDL